MTRKDFLKLVGLGALVAPVVKARKPTTEPLITHSIKSLHPPLTLTELQRVHDLMREEVNRAMAVPPQLFGPRNLDWYRDNWVPNIATTRFTEKKS